MRVKMTSVYSSGRYEGYSESKASFSPLHYLTRQYTKTETVGIYENRPHVLPTKMKRVNGANWRQ